MGNVGEFIEYLKGEVKNGSLYAWGGQGEEATEAAIERRESEEKNRQRVLKLYKKRRAAGYEAMRLFDCSGLGTYYLYNQKKLIPSDKTAQGLKALCREIAREELRPGDFVFRVYRTGSQKGRAYHIGYVVDEARNVVEAQGRDEGVVLRSLTAGGSSYWNAYGRPACLKEEIEAGVEEPAEAWSVSRLLKKKSPLMTGEDVRDVQAALLRAGYSCGKTGADGEYGNNTKKAVEAFQKAKGLTADGIVGENTTEALGGTWGQAAKAWSVSRVLKKTSPLMTGEDVRNVQTALIRAGHSCGKTGADGEYGNNTKKAVEAFQKQKGLTVDGKAGKNTVTALGGKWRG